MAWVFFAVGVTGCGDRRSDEEKILARLAQAHQAILDKDLEQFADSLDPAFRAQDIGGIRELKALLRMYFFRHRHIGVLLLDKEVRITRPRAEALLRFKAVVAGADGVIPENADVLSIEVELRRVSGDWRAIRARWERGLFQPTQP